MFFVYIYIIFHFFTLVNEFLNIFNYYFSFCIVDIFVLLTTFCNFLVYFFLLICYNYCILIK
nr:MAG TPA: hypothetical protein [Caudoviricetes sp.]